MSLLCFQIDCVNAPGITRVLQKPVSVPLLKESKDGGQQGRRQVEFVQGPDAALARSGSPSGMRGTKVFKDEIE